MRGRHRLIGIEGFTVRGLASVIRLRIVGCETFEFGCSRDLGGGRNFD
jgi:hypothetical protein